MIILNSFSGNLQISTSFGSVTGKLLYSLVVSCFCFFHISAGFFTDVCIERAVTLVSFSNVLPFVIYGLYYDEVVSFYS